MGNELLKFRRAEIVFSCLRLFKKKSRYIQPVLCGIGILKWKEVTSPKLNDNVFQPVWPKSIILSILSWTHWLLTAKALYGNRKTKRLKIDLTSTNRSATKIGLCLKIWNEFSNVKRKGNLRDFFFLMNLRLNISNQDWLT
jgi:hypothetical protein